MAWRRSVRIAATAAAALAAPALAAAELVTINGAAQYPEGPIADQNGIYYAEMGAGQVMRWNGTQNRRVWSNPACGPTSVARYGADLIVLCHRVGALVRISPSGELLQVVDRDRNGRPFVTPNASVADGKGGVYFSSSGSFSPTAPAEGAVLYLDPARRLSRLVEGIHYANGVTLTADGGTLYVSEHLERQVLAFDVAQDGSLSGKRVFVRLDDLEDRDPAWGWEVGPDGLAVDREGNLYIAEYGAGHLLIVGPDALLKATIDVPEAYVTAPALSPDETRLYITAPASLYDPTEAGGVYEVANPLLAD